MKFLITGGTGFIGRHLINSLIKKGSPVRMLVRKTADTREFSLMDVELFYGDLRDKDSLGGIDHDIDIVYHLAGQMGEWGVNEEQFHEVNIKGTRNLLQSCLGGNIKLFVYVSTPGVIGFCGNILADETYPYNPRGIYEKTKADGERTALQYCKDKKLPVTIIRPDFVYGPGDLRRLKLFLAIKNNKFLIVGNGKSLLHPTYIDDVIRGLELITYKTGVEEEIYNIAGPKAVTIQEFIGTIADVLGVRVPGLKVPSLLAYTGSFLIERIWNLMGKQPPITRSMVQFLTVGHASDISKAKKQLHYNPEIGLREGIEKTIQWYKEKGLI